MNSQSKRYNSKYTNASLVCRYSSAYSVVVVMGGTVALVRSHVMPAAKNGAKNVLEMIQSTLENNFGLDGIV